MQFSPLTLFLFCSAVFASAVAWTPEDHEIFDLVSALEAAEGPKVTFYSYLNVSSSASTSDIARSFKKRSLELHPDRGGDEKRFARLGSIATILKDSEKRKRYQHFYENGVPRWRGTGYYYSRYRPGLGFVTVFLVLLSVIAQYSIQQLTRYSEVSRIRRFQDRAKEVAWGSTTAKPIDVNSKKKVKVALGGSRDASNAVTMSVEGNGRICIIDESGESHVLDESAAVRPSLMRTWLPRLTKKLLARISSKPASITSFPASTGIRDVGADRSIDTRSPVESDSEGQEVATDDPASMSTNRKSRRADLKAKSKKKK